ncbi:unnamed protein product [Rotaria sp. Silwood1]|nr:unnamed protein product [Rotaria sp. Silwood1]CAF1331680.1 unnamed protein product [Rotaria sp. Silwood1]
MNYQLIEWYRKNPDKGPACDILFGDFNQHRLSQKLISIMMSTDGKPLTTSNNSSIWPVVGMIAQIPHPIREYQKNIMLFGLWHSCVSPNPDRLLSSIVHDLMVLRAGGLTIDVGTESN